MSTLSHQPETVSPTRISIQIAQIARQWQAARKIAMLTGAGISAESGVPTFRGKEGLWNSFKPEELASMTAFLANPKIVWEWYNWRRDLLGKAEPNDGHRAIVTMSTLTRHFTLITQNVDSLHQRAGSKDILELHGNISVNKCVDCNKIHDAELEIDPSQIATCTACGGRIRPGVVWFGENLDPDVIDQANESARESDLFFVVGTSALVYPASQLPLIAKQSGSTVVEINPEETPLSDLVDFRFAAPSGEILPALVDAIRRQTEQRKRESV